MPTVKLTDAAVKRFKAAPGERIDYFDAMLPGFGLRVSGPTPRHSDGTKSWVLMYRYGGIKKRLTIEPSYPALGLADARQEAREALQRLGRGEDPARAKEAAEQKAHEAARDTVEVVIDEFMHRYMAGKQRAPRYIAETRRNFDNHVLPVWRRRLITTITRRDVIELLDGIVDAATAETTAASATGKRKVGGRIAANRTRAALSKLFNWCTQRGIIEASPVAMVDRPGAEKKRTRVLTDEELRLIWRGTHALPYPFRPYFRLILATAQRREETATARWCPDINPDEAVWMIPAEANKPDRTHAVPLSPLALAILAECPRHQKYVFTTRRRRRRPGEVGDPGEAPISGYSKAKADLDGAVAAIAACDGLPAPEPWTIHDLRRTATTTLGKLGVSRFIQKRVLNHADSDVTGIYDRYEYLPEKREALDKWAGYLARLTSNVVPLRRPV